jgi:hypothetical protein
MWTEGGGSVLYSSVLHLSRPPQKELVTPKFTVTEFGGRAFREVIKVK